MISYNLGKILREIDSTNSKIPNLITKGFLSQIRTSTSMRNVLQSFRVAHISYLILFSDSTFKTSFYGNFGHSYPM